MSRMSSTNIQNQPTTWELIAQWEPKEPEHKVLFTTIRLDSNSNPFGVADSVQDAKRETLTTSVRKIFGEGVVRFCYDVQKKALQITVSFTFTAREIKYIYYLIQESTGDFDWEQMRIHADFIRRGIDPTV